jgi:hypothetical protein
MGYLTSNSTFVNPHAGRVQRAQEQCGLHLGQVKAANKKTFTRLGEGLAYNAHVADRTGDVMSRNDGPAKRRTPRRSSYSPSEGASRIAPGHAAFLTEPGVLVKAASIPESDAWHHEMQWPSHWSMPFIANRHFTFDQGRENNGAVSW